MSNWGTGESRQRRQSEHPSVAEWRELAMRGLTVAEAARERKVSVSAAHKANAKHGLGLRPNPKQSRKGIATKPLSHRYDNLSELLEQDLTLRQIGGILGVTSVAVINAMKVRGLKRPKNWRKLRRTAGDTRRED